MSGRGSGPRRERRISRCESIRVGILFALALLASPVAEARTRNVCAAPPFYGGYTINCGGHLQAQCTSGSACDAGHSSYTGSPLPLHINCPSPIPDFEIALGCYDQRPDCGDCSGNGQIPCPPQAEPWCAQGCDSGLTPHPLTGLCAAPSQPGDACGPAAPCSNGLVCDPLSGFVCVAEAAAGESCANPFVRCASGLQCTLALECAHAPYALVGETCDVTAPCEEGAYCQAGIPQRCEGYRLPGEGCSAFNPCIEGATCLACSAGFCDHPLQCFWTEDGPISITQCNALRSDALQAYAIGTGEALTVSFGESVSAGYSTAISTGQAYGPSGEYGCYVTQCEGFSLDASVEVFGGLGRYVSYYAAVGIPYAGEIFEPGTGTMYFVEAQVAGSVVNYVSASVWPGQVDPQTVLIGPVGEEHAFSIGVGASPLPFSVGTYDCSTFGVQTLDYGPGGPPSDVPPPVEPPPDPDERPGNLVTNGDFDLDLASWFCENGGECAWATDDPSASTLSGSGTTSNPAGNGHARIASACLPVVGGEAYAVSAWLKTTGGGDGSFYAIYSGNASCFGDVVGQQTLLVSPPDGTWRSVDTWMTAPLGAQGLALKATASRDAGTGEAGVTRIDQVYLPEARLGIGLLVGTLGLAWRGARRAGRDRAGWTSALNRAHGSSRRPGGGAI